MIRRLRYWLLLKLAGTEMAVINTSIENLSTATEIKNCLFIGHARPMISFPNVAIATER